MSRCFPYTRLGYLRDGAHGEAVSESIKLQSDGCKAITEHTKKKTEKKQSKKNRKENKGCGYSVNTCNQQGKGLLPKGKEDEAERSCLTDEHEQSVYSQSLCHSPDSTRSSKRKGDDLSYDGIKRNGNIIRIPVQRHRDLKARTSREQLVSSGEPDSLPQQKEIAHGLPISSMTRTVACGPIEAAGTVDLKPETASGVPSHGKRVQSAESLHKALTEEWVLPPINHSNFDDQDWLFETKIQERHPCKRLKSHRDETCHASSTLWPIAHHLPEADIWQLPYTIPF